MERVAATGAVSPLHTIPINENGDVFCAVATGATSPQNTSPF